jgi:UPF0755 protein
MVLVLRRFFYCLLLLACFALIGAFLWKKGVNNPLPIEKNEIIYVSPGSSIYSIAEALASKGILPHPRLFLLLAKLEGKEKKLKTGEYLLHPGITPKQLLTELVEGKVMLRKFTVIEGWTLKQVFNSIDNNPYLTHTLKRLTTGDFSKKMGFQYTSFEGYFYPDTYLFAAGIQDVVILKKAFWNMKQKLDILWKKRSTGLPYPHPYSALIVASLIERETARPEERAKIAGVIIRRLQKKILLQIDASVIYGLGEAYTGKLSRDDLRRDTPFNSYLHTGLPPTPIAMPSLPSIIAALHPEAGTSLYYVARGDGTHEFTDTLAEHHAAVRKYHHPEHLDVYNPRFQGKVPWFSDQQIAIPGEVSPGIASQVIQEFWETQNP